LCSTASGSIISFTMQDLSDEERREALGEVLADELKAILEYVKDIPQIKEDLTIVKIDVANLKEKFNMHEADIRYLRSKFA
jgi:hypothetical protein